MVGLKDVWLGEGARRALKRCESLDFPDDFLKNLAAQPAELDRRFLRFLRLTGQPFGSVAVHINELDARGLHGVHVEVDGRAGAEVGISADDLLPFAWASADEYKLPLVAQESHAVLPDTASIMLSDDIERICSFATHAGMQRTMAEILVPGLQSFSTIPGRLSDNLALVAKARRARLSLPGEISATELIRFIDEKRWFNRLPTRTARFGLFTGAGLVADFLGAGGIGTAAGIGLGAFDSFLLDRLLGGWKPNQFVQYKELLHDLAKPIERSDG